VASDFFERATVTDGLAGPAVRVEGLSRWFGSVAALLDVDLEIPAGSVLGLLGPNGAGKTTLVRILTTLLKPSAGRAFVGGLDVVTEPESVRRLIGLAGQNAAIDDILTGLENLETIGQLYHLPKHEAHRRANLLIERFSLGEARDRRAGTYSGGMRRRLDLAASLVGRPSVLFLDEPTTGLDPVARLDLWQLIEELVAEGTTVLLTTQYLEEADRLGDHIVVIDEGRIIAQGTASELKERVGGSVVHVGVLNRDQLDSAVETLGPLGDLHVERQTGEVSFPAHDGTEALTQVVRALDKASIPVSKLAVQEPTLDDVFLSLTRRTPTRENAT